MGNSEDIRLPGGDYPPGWTGGRILAHEEIEKLPLAADGLSLAQRIRLPDTAIQKDDGSPTRQEVPGKGNCAHEAVIMAVSASAITPRAVAERVMFELMMRTICRRSLEEDIALKQDAEPVEESAVKLLRTELNTTIHFEVANLHRSTRRKLLSGFGHTLTG